MTAPTATDARRVALSGLIDHAALFPPASMSMSAALAEDRRVRASPASWLVDRFVCPASRLEELAAALGSEPAPPLSVVLDPDGAVEQLGAVVAAVRAGLPLAAVEAKPRDPAGAGDLARRIRAALGPAVDLYLEVDPGTARPAPDAADAGAKLRCGGVTRDAFPTVEQVARFICACRDAGIAFKATAGLHHPVRRVDPVTGFPMHGFLNLLAAAAHALGGASERDVRAVVAERSEAAFGLDVGGLRAGDLSFGAPQLARVRAQALRAYGSCSVSEPVADLRGLGMLPAAAAIGCRP